MLLVIGTCLVLAQLVFGNISTENPACGKCVCAEVSSSLNIRDAPWGNKIGSIMNQACFKFTGGREENGGHTWFSFDYNGNPNAWASGRYLGFGADNRCRASKGSEIQALEGMCLCVKTNGGNLNGRDAPTTGGGVAASLRNGECFRTVGPGQRTEANGHQWFRLNRNRTPVWAAAQFLRVSCDEDCDNQCNDFSTVTRGGWGADEPKSITNINKPVPHVIIHHTATDECDSTEDCKSMVKSFQDNHMNVRDWADIGYNFLIGGDCQVYEGRGWDRQGAHTQGYNNVAYGIAFIGTYGNKLPSACMLEAARNLIQCGVESGDIDNSYSLAGHRDVRCSMSPGDALYGEISTWNN